MRFLVFHSQTGAAALAAALRYLALASSAADLLSYLPQLPSRGQFFLCQETAAGTVLAAASGAEAYVLEHAFIDLTRQFRADAAIEVHYVMEPRDMSREIWLARRGRLTERQLRQLAESIWEGIC
ncbi:MAG: hypothetical protein ACOX18_02435 [Bacillota bacterium]|jgi:hypothetical protein